MKFGVPLQLESLSHHYETNLLVYFLGIIFHFQEICLSYKKI